MSGERYLLPAFTVDEWTEAAGSFRLIKPRPESTSLFSVYSLEDRGFDQVNVLGRRIEALLGRIAELRVSTNAAAMAETIGRGTGRLDWTGNCGKCGCPVVREATMRTFCPVCDPEEPGTGCPNCGDLEDRLAAALANAESYAKEIKRGLARIREMELDLGEKAAAEVSEADIADEAAEARS